MHLHHAKCHCDNIEAVFETSHNFETLGIRACACSFCRKHNARTASDPQGALNIIVHKADKLICYSFAMETLEILLCETCGVYVAAIFKDTPHYFGVLNVNSLTDRLMHLPMPVPMDYDGKNQEQRKQRLKARWTPIKSITIGGMAL